ncbi:hypothetical protein HDV05_004655, partial [Chytridiales sp. JEL 0842]
VFTTSINNAASQLSTGYQLTLQQGILGAVLIAIGLFLLIAGFKLWKPTIFLAGFLLASSIGYTILLRVEPAQGYDPSARDNILLFGSLAIGLLGGLIVLCVRQVGLAAIGAIGGYALAIFILGFTNNGIIQVGWGRIVFILAFIIIAIVLVFFVEKWVVIVSTSMAGAYLVVLGIDMYAKTGFAMASQSFFQSGTRFDSTVFTVNGKVIAMTASVAVLAIVGVVVQSRMNAGRSLTTGGK